MYSELSKSQKKIARALIDKGLEIECGNCLENIKSLLSGKKGGAKTNHELYLKVYKSMYKFDKHLAKRYDNLGGSRYLITVLGLYMDDVLNDDDIAEFEEDIQNKLIALKNELEQ
ncbi:MAG: hypothetical protein LBD76_00380 [Prevotellaceae bacterium]|jgi:hypothetical protein|nr:hypothetical protein [Prevotellaceae bacterium]